MPVDDFAGFERLVANDDGGGAAWLIATHRFVPLAPDGNVATVAATVGDWESAVRQFWLVPPPRCIRSACGGARFTVHTGANAYGEARAPDDAAPDCEGRVDLFRSTVDTGAGPPAPPNYRWRPAADTVRPGGPSGLRAFECHWMSGLPRAYFQLGNGTPFRMRIEDDRGADGGAERLALGDDSSILVSGRVVLSASHESLGPDTVPMRWVVYRLDGEETLVTSPPWNQALYGYMIQGSEYYPGPRFLNLAPVYQTNRIISYGMYRDPEGSTDAFSETVGSHVSWDECERLADSMGERVFGMRNGNECRIPARGFGQSSPTPARNALRLGRVPGGAACTNADPTTGLATGCSGVTAVYRSTGPPKWHRIVHHGCWRDKAGIAGVGEDRTLRILKKDGVRNVWQCADWAVRQWNKRLFSVEAGGECRAGDDVRAAKRHGMSNNCGTNPDENGDLRGGAEAQNVYTIPQSSVDFILGAGNA